jgi:hypothetical protein
MIGTYRLALIACAFCLISNIAESADLELTVFAPNDNSLIQPTLQLEDGSPIKLSGKKGNKYIYRLSKIDGLEKVVVVKLSPNNNYTHADLAISLVRKDFSVKLPLKTTVISQKYDGGWVRDQYEKGIDTFEGKQLIALFQTTESFLNEVFSDKRRFLLTKLAENEVKLLILHAEVLSSLSKKLPWLDAPRNIDDRKDLIREALRYIKTSQRLKDRLGIHIERLKSAENLLWNVQARKYSRWWKNSIMYEVHCLDQYPLIVKFDQKMQNIDEGVRKKFYQLIEMERLKVLQKQSSCLEQLASKNAKGKHHFIDKLKSEAFAGISPDQEVRNLLKEFRREIQNIDNSDAKGKNSGHIKILKSILEDLS